MVDPKRYCDYTNEIEDSGQGPLFKVTCADDPANPVVNESTSAAWVFIQRAINAKRSKKRVDSISGPKQYGLSEKAVVQMLSRLPNATKCENFRLPKWIKDDMQLSVKPIQKPRTIPKIEPPQPEKNERDSGIKLAQIPIELDRFMPDLCKTIIDKLRTSKDGLDSLQPIVDELNIAHHHSLYPALADKGTKKRVLKDAKKQDLLGKDNYHAVINKNFAHIRCKHCDFLLTFKVETSDEVSKFVFNRFRLRHKAPVH